MKDVEKIGITGFDTESISIDMLKLQARKNEVIERLKSGILFLLKKHKVELIIGEASIIEENKISIKLIEAQDSTAEGEELQITADKIIIATGSKPIELDIPGADNPKVFNSTTLLERKEKAFERLVVIGGGVIGIEFAMLYNSLGSEVTIVEAMDSLLPEMDKEISQNMTAIIKKRGIKIMTKYSINSIEEDGEILQCKLKSVEKDKEEIVLSDGVLIAVGRKPNYQNLFSQNLKVEMDGNRILVNQKFETSINGIYAIGDVSSKIQLAHFASAQGTNLAIELSGKMPTIDLNVVPSCVYTSPEIASVGMTLEQAEKQGILANELKVQMQGNGKSVIEKQERGFIKVVLETESEKIIGAHIICNRATDMISEFVLAISLGLTRKDLAKIIRPHPTYSESISEVLFQ
jgi:dihydrolipoamide dehydrogenase